MEISNINVSNAYTTNNTATQTAGNASLEDKKTQAPGDTRKPETPPSSQQAFQVNITQKAQEMLAAETAPPPAQTTRSDNDSDDRSQNQRPDVAQQARQIINIVA